MLLAAVGYNERTDVQFIDYRMSAMMYKILIEVQIRGHATRTKVNIFYFNREMRPFMSNNCKKFLCISQNII